MLSALGELYGRQMLHLCLHDASLRDNRDVFSLFTSLRSLELGYSDLASQDVALILNKNASTLESARFTWVSTMPKNSLFIGVAPSAPLTRLRALHITGQVKMAVDETFQLLQSCPALRYLHIDDLDDAGALCWVQVLDRLIEAGSHKAMKGLSFGGPKTTCCSWWTSVARFVDHLDGSLESIMIHARQLGTLASTVADMPDELQMSFLHRDNRHPRVTFLVLIWRAVRGMDYATVGGLAVTFPNLELLHCYIVHPRPCTLDELVETVAAFQKLKRLHFISPATTDVNAADSYQLPKDLPPSLAGLHIAGDKYPWAPYFLAAVIQRCPTLERVSWIRHEPWQETDEDCLFVHVRRHPSVACSLLIVALQIYRDAQGNVTRCESLVSTYYECKPTSPTFTYNVRPDAPLTLTQRPSWRDDMGQALVSEGGVCKRAHIGREIESAANL